MRQAVKLLKALSDPTRLRILMLLMEKELCVCELVFILKMEQSRISHQLRVLRDADLVEDTREGKWTIYRIPEATKKNLRDLFETMLKDMLSEAGELRDDKNNLEICLEKNIRMTRCG